MEESRSPSELMWAAARAAYEAGSFGPLIVGLADALGAAGAQVDRIHVPMSKLNGFQHPLHATVLVLWERGEEVRIDFVAHEDITTESGAIDLRILLKGSPFSALFFEGKKSNAFRLDGQELPFEVLRELADDGYTDYLAFGLKLPNGSRQVLGLASRAPTGFGAALEELLLDLEPVISLAFFATYQAAISLSVSSAYIGPRTAIRVLDGAITRGHYETLDAGILFCDVRGFTRMSAELGVERLVPVMNQIFECVGEAVAQSHGEILKFMGDAMLVVFPRDQFAEDAELARQMVAVVLRADAEVKKLGERLGLDLHMGFGLHIGGVTYGNVGTRERLDFTVLGPAVNLASRLESLTKNLGVTLAASDSVARHIPGLHFAGRHKLHGIAEEIPVWCDQGPTL
jgi:adenylate cyclase